MPDTQGIDPSEASPPEPEGVSAFAARVLNQLSLSAWLPAAFLTLALTFLVKFRSLGAVDVSRAARELTDKDSIWGLAVLAVPVLVVATLVTQAFAFEAIRVLEGYWHRRGPAGWLASGLIWVQVWRKNRVARLAQSAAHDAFLESRRRWLDDTDPEVVNALELASLGKDFPEELDSRLSGLEWHDRCRPWRMRRVEGLELALEDFPVENRILPMRLGNVLRSAEDSLENAGGDLATFVMRRRSLVPVIVRSQHDQFRTRLEMYSTLVFVSTVLAAASIGLLWPMGLTVWALAVVGFGAIAVTSYHAAIASARGYAVTLRHMDKAEDCHA